MVRSGLPTSKDSPMDMQIIKMAEDMQENIIKVRRLNHTIIIGPHREAIKFITPVAKVIHRAVLREKPART